MSEQLGLELNDEQLPPMVGITTVLGQTTWPGDGLLKWAWKLGAAGTLLTDRSANERRTIGNDVHRIAELVADGKRPAITSLPVHVRGFAESLYRYHDEHRPAVLATEISLRHPQLRIRGRIDVVRACTGDHPDCRCYAATSPAGYGVVLADLKTGGKAGDPIHARDARQVAGAYPLLWDASYPVLPDDLRGRPCCGGEILRVYANGQQADAVPVPARADGFLAALAAYRDMEAHGDLPERTL